jgi:histidyl-tRNA synthetase
MIASKSKELSLPIRWYSIPNLFRYENPQKGRVREHWQLNVDIFGVESIDAEVEAISIASAILKKFGLKDNNFSIWINNRKIINYILNDIFDLSEEDALKVSKLLDKKDKMQKIEFEEAIREIIPKRYEGFLLLMNSENFEEFVSLLPQDENLKKGLSEIRELIEKLEKLGITNVVFKQGLMRGFDYYTGIVFEIFDTSPENRRSIFGGGRYDDLLEIFGKEKIPAVGFGCGDVIIRDMLATYGLMPKEKATADLYVCVVDRESIGYAQDFAQKLRESGIKVSVDYSMRKIGEQIKYADKNKIPFVVCVGSDEIKSGEFKIKELSSGTETSAKEDGVAGIILK